MSTTYINGDSCDQCSDHGMLTVDNILVENVKLAESKLSHENPYVFYEVNLSNEEINTLNSINFNSTAVSQLNNFETNSTTNNFKVSLAEFFTQVLLDNYHVNAMTSLVDRVFTSASSYNSENEITLLDVRVRSNNIGYPVPTEWHTDTFFQECQHRNFITLVGPSTLFYNDLDVKNQILSGNAELSEILSLRRESGPISTAGESLIDYSKVDRAEFGQGVIFYQGTGDAALHAGPREQSINRITITIDKCNILVIPRLLESLIEG